MNLEAVHDAPWLVEAHLASAAAAVALGAVQLAAPKGALPHRVLGWLWAGVFGLAVATSALLQDQVAGVPRLGPFSSLHLFTLLAVVGLPLGLWAARTRRVLLHRAVMVGVFAGVLLTAGLFALTPGRLLSRIMAAPVAGPVLAIAFPGEAPAAISGS
ncbi:DUF2306 domain-containing protein [Caulobacter sp. 17J80-11]|uniref:DUF2306 domain-containing protein n=1 Tax=Caulobacter sp. 17J80-11 TaxID=2763502 RepID=UPI001653C07C|nr:DUF2306 domain-containing protein [Caulobacter sp. 17J80-11]MBC6983108.1 hypothetical protein [Caulobacter sp. 17J80-11]